MTDRNEIYYFLHPYYTEKDTDTRKNINSCLKYVSILKSLGFYVYSPTVFFYLLDTSDKVNFYENQLRELDSKFLEKMDGLIISPYYDQNNTEINNIKRFFKLKNLPVLWFEELVI